MASIEEAHGSGAAVVKSHFAQAHDQALFFWLDVYDAFFDFRRQSFFQLRLNVFHGRGCGNGRNHTFHGLDNPIKFAGALDVFHSLYLGKRDGLRIAERDMGVGGFKNTQFLEGDLNGQGQASDTPLVYLRRRVENHKESEKQGDEVGIANHTVSNVINGVTLNLGSPSPNTPVTLNVSPNTTQVTAAINTFVSAYNTVVNDINTQFKVASDGSGGGPLEADNTLRDVQSQLLGAISYSTTGNSGIVNLASMGINMNDDGTLSVDNGALSAALSSNFSAVQNFLQNATTGFAQNLSQVISNVNSPGTGLLSIDAQSITNTSQDLSTQISDLQASMAVQQQQLTTVYAQVNATLQELPVLESQISQQLTEIA